MIPNATRQKILNGSIDYGADDIRVALFDDSVAYSPDPDTVEFVTDLLDGGTTAAEYSDTNYARQSLANQSTSQDNTNDRSVWDADDTTFASLGSSNGDTIQGVVIFKQVTDDTDSPILRVIDDSEEADLPLATNGSDVTIEWSASDGIKTLS